VKTFEAKSLIQHAADSTFWPNPRRRVSHIQFTPEELFGAMARCSYLHPVDPGAVTFESEGCRHLIAQHVDDQADDFFILPTVRRLKDFSRTHLVGIVGAGIAYLQTSSSGSMRWIWGISFSRQ